MNQFKKIVTIIFVMGALIAFTFVIKAFITQSQNNVSAKFVSTESVKYVNYYVNRIDYQFKTTDENFVIIKNSREAIFKKDAYVDLFLETWTTYDQRLYPNSDCELIRISIPYTQKDLQGNIVFTCVDSIQNDLYSNLSIYN